MSAPLATFLDEELHNVYNLVTNYKSEIDEAACCCDRYVYDSVVEAEAYQVFDANKQLKGFGDIYPEDVDLQPGDHTIRLMLRHDDLGVLSKFTDLSMVVERKLKDKDIISLKLYPSNSDAVKEDKALKDPFTLCKGRR